MPSKAQTGQAAEDRLRLPRRQSADLRRAGARRKCRIERVDVEAEIAGRVADDRANTLRNRLRAVLMDLLGGDNGDAVRDRPVEHVALNRRADPDLDHAAGIDKAFLDGVIEYRAMREGLTEIVRPGINMGVEMNERERTACAAPAPAARRA